MNENWKPVPGYEGVYEVSDLGRVRSLDRLDAAGRPRRGQPRSSTADGGGYLQVSLWRDGSERRVSVHRLVLVAFVGPAPKGMEACHNDGDSTNNTLANLRWDTRSANSLDRVRHGTHPEARKTHCPAGHPYDEANTYLDPRARRQCRPCRQAADRAYRTRVRAAS